ncbi:MAG: DUF4266 domain-containing protein [Lentisphaerae bacterium]|nr:DUF4266 domain-containing protein [Lentisphaerota bacterium]
MSRVSALLFLWALLAMANGCRSVPVYQRARLSDRLMRFDADPTAEELRQHILSPREAAIGGYATAGAGGCSCK